MKILLFISLIVSVETHFCDVCECIFDSDTIICEKSSLDFNNLQGRGPVSDYEYKTLIYKPDACDWSTRTDTILIDPKRYFHGLNKFVTSCCEKMGLNPEIVECETKETAAAEILKVVPKIAIGVGNIFVSFGDTNDTRETIITPENTTILLQDQKSVIEMDNTGRKIKDSFEKTVDSGFIFEKHDNETLLIDRIEMVKVIVNLTNNYTDDNSNKQNIIIAVSGFSVVFLFVLLFFLLFVFNCKCSKRRFFNIFSFYSKAFYFVLTTYINRIFGLPVNRAALADLLNAMFSNNNRDISV